MLKKEVLILDCPEIGCPSVLVIVFKELCGALQRKGIQVRVIKNKEEIHDDAIVFMGDNIQTENPGELLSKVTTKAVYVGWYWYKNDTSMLPHFIHIYENCLAEATLLPHKVEMKQIIKNIPNSCPLLLRANEAPEMIGSYKKNIKYDYCFMGGRMCYWLEPNHRYKGFYHGVHDTNEYLSYEERKEIYLSSLFALGFQTDDNISNGHVSQRIYEAMAYGCIVLSHSIHASVQTDGIVEYVEPDQEKYAQRMDFFLQNPDYIEKKRQRGYEFVRQYGTNDYAISLILEKIPTE